MQWNGGDDKRLRGRGLLISRGRSPFTSQSKEKGVSMEVPRFISRREELEEETPAPKQDRKFMNQQLAVKRHAGCTRLGRQTGTLPGVGSRDLPAEADSESTLPACFNSDMEYPPQPVQYIGVSSIRIPTSCKRCRTRNPCSAGADSHTETRS